MSNFKKNYLASNLKHLRLTNGKTLKDLAEVVDKTDVAIHYWEDGSREPNSIDLFKLAEYYNVKIDDLVKSDLRIANKNAIIRVSLYLPNNVYYLRNKIGISEEDLASQLGYSKESINELENGHKRADLYDVAKLSKIFNVSADDLLNKDLGKNEKYTKEETKEKITKILDNSDLEENKKNMIGTIVNMVCEEKESV